MYNPHKEIIIMAIKIITDSTSDIPPGLARELDITVVPIYVRFRDEVLRDGIDISSDELYKRLATGKHPPATSQPSPEDFTKTYAEYCDDYDGIISVHISSKISGTCNSARMAKKELETKCPIEIVDSRFNSAGLAIVVLAAARLAKAGKPLEYIMREVNQAIGQVRMFGMFETLQYLEAGGRVKRTIIAAASLLKLMLLLTFKDGDIAQAGFVRSVSKGMDRIYDFVEGREGITELAIAHSNVPERADDLKKRLGHLFPEDDIIMTELGAALGVHGGPGVLLVALRQGKLPF